jgi:hypothetical protein
MSAKFLRVEVMCAEIAPKGSCHVFETVDIELPLVTDEMRWFCYILRSYVDLVNLFGLSNLLLPCVIFDILII